MDLSETRSVIECSAFKEVFAATNIKNIFGPTSKTYSFLVPACRLFFIFRTGPKIPLRGRGKFQHNVHIFGSILSGIKWTIKF